MKGRPLLDETARGPGAERPCQRFAVEQKGRLLPLVFRVEVRHAMLLVEHPDDNAEEDRDDRHPPILPETGSGTADVLNARWEWHVEDPTLDTNPSRPRHRLSSLRSPVQHQRTAESSESSDLAPSPRAGPH